jgi:ketosteroid isomerase-like protein
VRLVARPEDADAEAMNNTETIAENHDLTAADLVEELRERMFAWRDAFASKDVDAIFAFYATDGFTAFDLMPPFEFGGGPMWRQGWEDFYAAFDGPLGLDMADLVIHASGDIAVARCAVRMRGTMNGLPMNSWVRTTNCFRRIDGEWLMFHDHVSWPIDFATGKALMDLEPKGSVL